MLIMHCLSSQLRSVILLNLGSLVDLADFFNLSSNGEYTLHVIDSHRPCNLDNLFSNQPEASNILVWDDGDVQDDMQEERTAYEALEVSMASVSAYCIY
jgi:cell division control protein 45